MCGVALDLPPPPPHTHCVLCPAPQPGLTLCRAPWGVPSRAVGRFRPLPAGCHRSVGAAAGDVCARDVKTMLWGSTARLHRGPGGGPSAYLPPSQ